MVLGIVSGSNSHEWRGMVHPASVRYNSPYLGTYEDDLIEMGLDPYRFGQYYWNRIRGYNFLQLEVLDD